jgi:hypothetical protein
MLPPRPTDWLQESRLVVVSFDPASRHLRVRGAQDACSDVRCAQDTVVVTDEHADLALDALSPGDIVKLESSDGGPTRIVVLRRAWEEYASPEL